MLRSGGETIRLYLVDLPGESGGVLTIAVMTIPDEFEDTIAEAAPIIDSVELHID